MEIQENQAQKARGNDFPSRFREIISDPLNLAIERHPLSGCLDEDCVVLHNGVRVPANGPSAYYRDFSQILVINRGVHEPLEEYVFQEVLKELRPAPVMLELGAYWGHYSMWLKYSRPEASVHLVEPEPQNIQVGRDNFARNGLDGIFIESIVGKGEFEVDRYIEEKNIGTLDILHADIQGSEVEMLEGAQSSLDSRRIAYIFVSTHSQALHHAIIARLNEHGYRIEISSDFEAETTSYDGLVFASSPCVCPVFKGFRPLGRLEIIRSSASELSHYLFSACRRNANQC